MREYLIDGNNLIHKVKNLKVLQNKDRQLAREKLALRLDGFFSGKSVRVFLYFDGFENLPIKTGKVKIIYSDKKTADSKIRSAIEDSSNPRNLVVVSSDDEIRKLAQACSGTTITSEDFAKIISSKIAEDEESKRINELDNDEFRKMFGVDE